MLTYYLTYDVDVLKVVGLQPDVDGLAREAAVGEGEHRLTSWLEHARHLLAHLQRLGEVVDAHDVGDDVEGVVLVRGQG